MRVRRRRSEQWEGGGGATEKHLEFARRQHDLAGCPRVEFGAAQPLLDRLVERRDELATWQGELYLEGHRGTLTTQAHIKKKNRELELLLRQVEMLYACRPAQEYPSAELLDCWRAVLVNQFHDVIPGSSIGQVYRDTARDHAGVEQTLHALITRVLQADRESGKGVTAVNLLSHDIDAVVSLPTALAGAASVTLSDGQHCP